MEVTSYIMAKNNKAQEMIDYYQQTLNAKLLFIKKSEDEKMVEHAVLQVGNDQLMIADPFPEIEWSQGNLVNLCLTVPTPKDAKRLYQVLKQNGQVLILLESTYFSPAYGMVTDQYGVTFQIFTKRS